MQLLKRSTNVGSEHQCGPTLMITMTIAVLAIFAVIWIFSQRHNVTPPHTGQRPAVATLPNQ